MSDHLRDELRRAERSQRRLYRAGRLEHHGDGGSWLQPSLEYLSGVTLARQSADRCLLRVLRQIPSGILVEVGTSGIDLSRYFGGSHVSLDVVDLPANTVTADAGQLPFATASLDLIICVSVIEHAAEPWRLLAEAARTLRRSGRMLLSWPWMFEAHMLPNDFRRISLPAMAERASANGLEIEALEAANGYFGCVAHFLQARRWLRPAGLPLLWLDRTMGPSATWATQLTAILRPTLHPADSEGSRDWRGVARCPRCAPQSGGKLLWTETAVTCTDCAATYERRDGRIDFLGVPTPTG